VPDELPSEAYLLDELLERWQELQAQGEDVAADVLCRDRPYLAAELTRRIEAMKQMQGLVERIEETALFGPENTWSFVGQEPPRAPKLKGFEFHHVLGRGAFGEVWLATDLNLRQKRAIKLLDREQYTTANVARLIDEGRRMAELPRHRNRVQVHALLPGVSNCYLVMEHIDGGALSRHTSPEAPLRWERAARYTADVGDALADVHAAGLLHRDVKPANVLLDTARDEALLADFGIAACARPAGGIAGTIGYLAPELLDGLVSPKADVFSLAATLFHLVVGRPPFPANDAVACLEMARRGLSRPVEELQNVPPAIEEVILLGLEPAPQKRIDLATFTARLRGAHLQALADRLLEQSRRAGSRVGLRVDVLTANERDLVFRPVACHSQPLGALRNVELVPAPAPTAAVRTGDLLRLEVTADADGYLTILNLASSGTLQVLFPSPLARESHVRAGVTQRLTVKLTPPAGTDRAAVIWSRRPGTLTPAEWRERIEAGQSTEVSPSRSTRGMDFVLHEAEVRPADEWTARVVAITHEA
jgi:hypothetical protein